MTPPLSLRLREATQALHTEVERAGLMRRLLRGELSRDGYVRLLRHLHRLYRPLEAGLWPAGGPPPWPAASDPALPRLAALAHDLRTLGAAPWADGPADDPACVPAARDYAAHLQQLAAESPALLAAHAYVRYLGDLSGGQLLSRLVARSPALGPTVGVAFYDFGGPEVVARLARSLRDGLDRLGDDAALADRLVAEACDGFARHRALFEQLDMLEAAAAGS